MSMRARNRAKRRPRKSARKKQDKLRERWCEKKQTSLNDYPPTKERVGSEGGVILRLKIKAVKTMQ